MGTRRKLFFKNVRITLWSTPVSSSFWSNFLSFIAFLLAAFLLGDYALAQNAPPPVTFTAEQDHQNMMDQLGIKALRPGPSGNEDAPNHANYDEALANPYPNLPDPLTMNDGTKVTTAKMWWEKRRPELVAKTREGYWVVE